MVRKSAFLLEICLVLLVLTSLAYADKEYPEIIPCSTDSDCVFLVAENSYCNPITLTCFLKETNVTIQVTNTTKNVSVANVSAPNLTSIESRLNSIESSASQLQLQVNQISQKVMEIDQLNTKMGEMQGQVDNLNTNLQSFNYQQEQGKEDLKNQLNKAVTGLAVLQTNLNETQAQLSQVQEDLGNKGFWLKFISYLFLTLVIVTAAVISGYYYNAKRKREEQFESELTPAIHAYLTQQIRLGKKFPQIKENLMQSGWNEEEARWAYKETMKHNYSEFKNKSVPKEAPAAPKIKIPEFTFKSIFQHDVTKVLSILIFATLLVLGALLLLRGVTTGKAIYQQEAALDNNVRTLLEKNFMSSTFYDKLSFVDLCVQVENNGESTSYRILKTNLGYALQKAAPCDWSNGYDFAFKFTDYSSFSDLMSDLSCDNIRSINVQGKKLYVLPSKYILPGLALNQEKDITKFCTVLKECVSDEELAQLSISC
jgi:hypothetical protein